MFDIKKYEKIKKVYKYMSYVDIAIIFSAFGFVYSIMKNDSYVMEYILCLALGITTRYYLTKIIKNEEI